MLLITGHTGQSLSVSMIGLRLMGHTDLQQHVLSHASSSYTIVTMLTCWSGCLCVLSPCLVDAHYGITSAASFHSPCCQTCRRVLLAVFTSQAGHSKCKALPNLMKQYQKLDKWVWMPGISAQAAGVWNKHTQAQQAFRRTFRERHRHHDLLASCTTQFTFQIIKQPKLHPSMVHKCQ